MLGPSSVDRPLRVVDDVAFDITPEGADMGKIALLVMVSTYVAERVALGQLVPRSAVRVRGILTTFVGECERLDRDHVIAWRDTRRQALAPGTMRAEWGVVRTWCRWLVARGHLDDDPCVDLPAPKVPRQVPRALTPEQMADLRAVLPDSRARAIVALMSGMGLRLSEVCGLEVGDWDRWSETMTVRGKGGHVRLLPVPTRVRAELLAYLNDEPAPSGPLIRGRVNSSAGISPVRISHLMADWMRAAGIKVASGDGNACHSLRHTFAQSTYMACGDLRTVQEALGHASISSTAIYMRSVASMDRLRVAMDEAA
jgi:site-specific recombinase XerC